MRAEITRGEMIAVLDEFSTPFPGFYLYYPQRRHASTTLRAFVEYLRDTKGTKSVGRRKSGSA